MINNWESCISCLLSSKYLWIQEFYERISSSDYSSCVEEVIENPTLYPPIILEFGTFGHILVTACKNMRFKRGSYRTGRDTSSFLVWITLGLSWVLPLVLGLDAWVFSLHLQTCCWSWIPVYSWEVAQQPIALRSSLHSTANRVVSFPKAVIKCIVQKQGVTIYDSCVCWLIFDFHLLIALAFFVQIL